MGERIENRDGLKPAGATAEPAPPKQDWLLQKIVSTANETGAEIGITMIVGGAVISGSAISGKQYFDEFGKFFANSDVFTAAQRKDMEDTYREFGEKRYTSLPAAEVRYVHLKNVLILHEKEPLRLPLFRIRLSKVEGFTVGSIVQS
jgi:hypothetical protein